MLRNIIGSSKPYGSLRVDEVNTRYCFVSPTGPTIYARETRDGVTGTFAGRFVTRSCCFLPPTLFPSRPNRSTRSQVSMRKGKSSKKKPPPSQRLTPQQKARFAEIASEYGVEAPKPGSQLDRKYNETPKEEPRQTLYQSLSSSVGVANLEMIEKGLFVALGGLLLFVIGSGLVISSEAFFKASGKPIPEGFDAVATTIEGGFTPALVLFLVLSSILGIYKQSQLSSGASSYTELGPERKDK